MTLLTLAALAGVVCLLAAAAALTLHITPLVFRSGSMAPEIPTGSLALARSVPAEELKVGDVVSVTNAHGTRVTRAPRAGRPVRTASASPRWRATGTSYCSPRSVRRCTPSPSNH